MSNTFAPLYPLPRDYAWRISYSPTGLYAGRPARTLNVAIVYDPEGASAVVEETPVNVAEIHEDYHAAHPTSARDTARREIMREIAARVHEVAAGLMDKHGPALALTGMYPEPEERTLNGGPGLSAHPYGL